MKVVCSLLVCLLLAAGTGCTASKATQSIDNAFDWSALVKPQDPVPPECRGNPPQPPVMDPNKAYTAKEAAREQKKMRDYAKSLRRRHVRCATWARGQR